MRGNPARHEAREMPSSQEKAGRALLGDRRVLTFLLHSRIANRRCWCSKKAARDCASSSRLQSSQNWPCLPVRERGCCSTAAIPTLACRSKVQWRLHARFARYRPALPNPFHLPFGHTSALLRLANNLADLAPTRHTKLTSADHKTWPGLSKILERKDAQ